MSDNINLYDDPNRYAGKAKLEKSGEMLKFYGYQEFSLTKDKIDVSASDPKLKKKSEFVDFLVKSPWFKDRSILDLGANSAYFCFLGLQNGAKKADAIEIDKKYVEMVNQAKEHLAFDNITMHDINVMDYEEPADIVYAFALIHWIYSCTSDYGSLDQAVKKLADLTNEVLIIEWVDKEDDAIKFFSHIDFNKSIITEPYDKEHFEKALSKHFEKWEKLGDVKSTRSVYAAYKSESTMQEIRTNSLLERDKILKYISENDKDHLFTFYLDLTEFMQEDSLACELDVIVSDDVYHKLKEKYGFVAEKSNIGTIELNYQFKYIINLINREKDTLPGKLKEYLLKESDKRYDKYNVISLEALIIYCLFKMVYNYAAVDMNLRDFLIELARQIKSDIPVKSTLKPSGLDEILIENGITVENKNDFISYFSFPYIYPLKNCFRSRLLYADGENKFISRLYKLDDKVVKQANNGLAENEFEKLNKLNSDYFPKVRSFKNSDSYDSFEMDFIEGYSLEEKDRFNQELSKEEREEFVLHLLNILKELEDKDIIHRDFNGENIIVHNKKPILIDFGWAVFEHEENPFTPSALNGNYKLDDGTHSDVYAAAKTIEDNIEGDFSELVKEMKENYKRPVSDFILMMNQDNIEVEIKKLINLLDEEKFEEALDLTNELTDWLPHQVISKGNLHFTKAICLFNLGEFEEALDAVNAEIIVNPGFEKAYGLQDKIKSQLGDKADLEYSNFKEEAEEDFTEAPHDAYDVSIIIPAFNRVELTEQCLEKLYEVTDDNIKYEVVVVDNASSDRTQEVCEEFDDNFANFQYIKNDENLGFAKACNQGIKARRGKHALLLNNDIVPTKNWLVAMMNLLEKEPNAGIIGSCLLFPESDFIQHTGVRLGVNKDNSLGPYHPHMFEKRSEFELAKNIRKVTAVTGACFLIRDELIDDIGILDEGYLNSFEDIDYCLTALTNNWNVFYCGESVLYHFESMSQFRHKHDTKNWKRFNEKWLGKIKPDETKEETNNEFRAIFDRQDRINKANLYDYKKIKRKVLGKEPDEIEFSIIIPVHSNDKLIKNCLIAIHKTSTIHNVEAIIIDNDSDPETKEFLSTLGGFAKVIRNTENVSYAKANNQGAEIARGKYLIFLNDDTKVMSGWLEALEHTFEEDDNVGIQGGKLLYHNDKVQHAGIVWGPVDELNGENIHYHIHLLEDSESPKVNQPQEVQMVTGALLSIRKELFNEVGGFDENYYFGHEDLDLCMKVRDAGFKVWYNPDCAAYHYESVTKNVVGMEKFERYFKNPESYDANNHKYFLKKWGDKLEVDAHKYKAKVKKVSEKTEDSKKRILSTMFGWNETGGGTTFPKSVAKALVLKGYDVFVIFAGMNHPESNEPYYIERSTDNGVNLIGIYNRPSKFLDYDNPEREIEDENIVEIFEKQLDEIQPDLVNFHSFIGLSFAIANSVKKRNIKSIFTPYNYHPIDPKLYMFTEDLKKWDGIELFKNSDIPELNSKREVYEQRTIAARNAVNSNEMILAVSDRQKEIYEQFGISSDKLFKVNQIHENLNNIKRVNHYNPGKPLKIGFMGAVIPQKGIQNLIAACSQFPADKLELHVYGFINEEYKQILENIETKCKVIYHGSYDNSEFNDIANTVDVMAVPSIWEDCAPFVVQEALAMGIPVIGSDLGGISDFVEDGYNGIIYKHDDINALKEIIGDLIDNHSLLLELHNNCKVSLSFNNYINHLTNIYNSLIEDNSLTKAEVELSFKEVLLKGRKSKNDIYEALRSGDEIKLYFNFKGEEKEGYLNAGAITEGNEIYDYRSQKILLDSNSVSELLIENCLEYLDDKQIDDFLEECGRVLIAGNEIEIIVADIDKITENYATGKWNVEEFNSVLFDNEPLRVVNSFNQDRLNDILENSGFEEIVITQSELQKSDGIKKPVIKAQAKNSAKAQKVESNKHGFIKPKDYQYSEDFKPQLNIVWEGTQFVHHSLALINREHCSNIIDAEVADLTIVPYEPEKFVPTGNEKYKKLYFHDLRVKPKLKQSSEELPYVWIRHQWPPKGEAPEGAKWIINQPWEFSKLTKDILETFNKADEIWTPSTWCRNVYIDSGVDEDKIQVMPNGIDPELFKPGGSKYSLKTDKKVKFLYVGGTIVRKGIDILLDTFIKTFTKYDNVCLVIKDMGGDSFYKGQTAKEFINKIQLIDDAPDIEYIDEMLSEEEIASLYRACDVFVCPYRGEGFSLPTLEAMASGLPVIVTKGGATDDFVDENVGWRISAGRRKLDMNMGDREFIEQAYLLEPEQDHLKEILRSAYDNSTSLKSIGLIASLRARKNFTWKRSTQKILKRLDYLYGTEMSQKAMVKLNDKKDVYITLAEAEEAFNQLDYEKAIDIYKQLIDSGELDQEYNDLAVKALALIYVNNGDHKEAENWIGRLDKNKTDYKYLRAKNLAFTGELTIALELLTEVMNNWQKIRYESTISLTLDHILAFTGQIMTAQQDIESAMQVYSAAIDLNELNFEALYGLAECFIAVEDREKAIKYLEITLEVNPYHAEAKNLLDELKVEAL